MTEMHPPPQTLEGIFAISKPPTITTPQILLDLQSLFSTSSTFAPLLSETRRKRAEQAAHQPAGQKQKDEEAEGRWFRMGHGGTLDPLASGVLIVGIGRGTKALQRFLGGWKTYETVVLFGRSTDTYDSEGEVTGTAGWTHVLGELVERKLKEQFVGRFEQTPPVYSGLKIGGRKAVEYAREGKELPRGLENREVEVAKCEMVEWMDAGRHCFRLLGGGDGDVGNGPAARIRITVSSGFYVRSFAHDLGMACGSLATMVELRRTQQGGFTTEGPTTSSDLTTSLDPAKPSNPHPPDLDSATPELIPAIPYADFHLGEHAWAPKIVAQLTRWMEENPTKERNGRHEEKSGARQRFRGEWLAETKKERIKQQGGKWKGKYNQQRKKVEGQEGREIEQNANGKPVRKVVDLKQERGAGDTVLELGEGAVVS